MTISEVTAAVLLDNRSGAVVLCLVGLLAGGVAALRQLRVRGAVGPGKASGTSRPLAWDVRWNKFERLLREAASSTGAKRQYRLSRAEALLGAILEDFRAAAGGGPASQQALARALNNVAVAGDRLWNAAQRHMNGDEKAADRWRAEALRYLRAAGVALGRGGTAKRPRW